jgi:hypothetical protein
LTFNGAYPSQLSSTGRTFVVVEITVGVVMSSDVIDVDNVVTGSVAVELLKSLSFSSVSGSSARTASVESGKILE